MKKEIMLKINIKEKDLVKVSKQLYKKYSDEIITVKKLGKNDIVAQSSLLTEGELLELWRYENSILFSKK